MRSPLFVQIRAGEGADEILARICGEIGQVGNNAGGCSAGKTNSGVGEIFQGIGAGLRC